uniref:Uncharacterized protein n=1 Tax=viral metagenome TaxID=1070528 RepID=A0A6H2A3C4_9ZZZZ
MNPQPTFEPALAARAAMNAHADLDEAAHHVLALCRWSQLLDQEPTVHRNPRYISSLGENRAEVKGEIK